jgi:hypothetical protein
MLGVSQFDLAWHCCLNVECPLLHAHHRGSRMLSAAEETAWLIDEAIPPWARILAVSIDKVYQLVSTIPALQRIINIVKCLDGPAPKYLQLRDRVRREDLVWNLGPQWSAPGGRAQ